MGETMTKTTGRVTKTDPGEVVKKYIDAKDNHRWDELVALLDPDCTSSDPSMPEPVKGIEGIRRYFPMLELVDIKTSILTILSKEQDVATELAVTCRIKEDGRSFTVKMAKFYRVNPRGLLAEEREYSDTAAKFKALGSEAASAFQAIGEDATGRSEAEAVQPADDETKAALADLTPQSIFATRIPAKLKENQARLADFNAICQFTITGDKGGSWYIDLTSTPPAVVAGTSDKAECTMTCSDRDFVNIVARKTNATLAVMTGKLKIAGDMGVAGVLRMVMR